MKNNSPKILLSLITFLALMVSNALSQTETTCPNKEVFASPPFYLYSMIKCKKSATGTCSTDSSPFTVGYVGQPLTGCKEDADCDKCNETVLRAIPLNGFPTKDDGSRPDYAICDDGNGILPKGGAKMDYIGTAVAEVDGVKVKFKYFDLSYAYEYHPEGQKDPTKKFVSIPVAVQLKEAAKGEANAATREMDKECDRLAVPFGLHTHEYVILTKLDKYAFLKSELMKESDTDPLN